MKCLVDIWLLFRRSLCSTRTNPPKRTNGGVDKMVKTQTRAPSSVKHRRNETFCHAIFLLLLLFLGQTILCRLLPGSTYYFFVALVCVSPQNKWLRSSNAVELRQPFIAGQSLTRPPRSAWQPRDCCVPETSRQTDPRGKHPPPSPTLFGNEVSHRFRGRILSC